ncbi:MAG: glycosyltransferase family 2 protein [Rhodospirillaceae bacterium]
MSTRSSSIKWVRVVIVNFNGQAVLQACLDALAAQTLCDFEVIIVDNGSTDSSLSVVHLPDSRFSWLLADTNLGFAAANNLAARGCQAPWLVTLNPDAFAEPTWLDQLRKATERYPDVVAFGSTQIDAANRDRLDGCGDIFTGYGIPWRGGYLHPIDCLPPDGECFSPCAAAAMYRRDVFEAVGGFDKDFFCYVEDVDLGYRIRLKGYTSVQVSSAIVFHLSSHCTGRYSEFTLFHSYRNRVLLVFKNTPFPLVLFLFPLHIIATLYLLVRTRRDAGFRASFSGVLAGLAKLPGYLSARAQVQRSRRISSWRIIQALTWSVAKMKTRAIDLRAR